MKLKMILLKLHKEKEEEALESTKSQHLPTFSSTLPSSGSSNFFIQTNQFDNVTSRQSSDYDRQPSLISSTNGDPFLDQRNLPVDIAIQKFENLNKKPPLSASPSNSMCQTNLSRANTINSGNVSPTNISNLQRFNSLANNPIQASLNNVVVETR